MLIKIQPVPNLHLRMMRWKNTCCTVLTYDVKQLPHNKSSCSTIQVLAFLQNVQPYLLVIRYLPEVILSTVHTSAESGPDA